MNAERSRGAALIAVLADEHPERDAWVDEQARNAPGLDLGIPINDETYQGVWRTPRPERTLCHLFALTEDLPRLVAAGFEKGPVFIL